MAVAGTILQTTFAAVSFARAGYLFQHQKSGYEDEMKRHNKVLEDLAKSKELLFYENEIKKKDKILLQRQRLSDANADINQIKIKSKLY